MLVINNNSHGFILFCCDPVVPVLLDGVWNEFPMSSRLKDLLDKTDTRNAFSTFAFRLAAQEARFAIEFSRQRTRIVSAEQWKCFYRAVATGKT